MSKIDEIKLMSSIVNERLILESSTIAKTTTGKFYLNATLFDGTNKIQAKQWNWPATRVNPEYGKVYRVSGDLNEYNGNKQIIISSIEYDKNDQTTDEFEPVTPYTPNDDILTVANYIDRIGHKHLQMIVTSYYAANIEEVKRATSAKGVHHVGKGGNLAHAIEVCKIALSIADLFPQYKLNRDILIAGALMHDCGKLRAYVMNGPNIDMTHDGAMLDHIILGVSIVDNICRNLDIQVDEGPVRLLKHIIASHHGELQFGSPVVPVCMEAHLISLADRASAVLNTVWLDETKAMDADPGAFETEKIYVLGNRKHYTRNAIAAMMLQLDDDIEAEEYQRKITTDRLYYADELVEEKITIHSGDGQTIQISRE